MARLSSRRHRQLIETGAVSKEEYDASTLGYKSAEARRDAAQRRLEELKAGTRAERISAQRAAVAQLDAALVNVGVDIEESTLRAPFSGTIARRYFDEGSIVAPGSALLRIVEDTRLEAWIGLPAALAGKLTKGDEVSLKIAERVHQAEVEAVLPELDSTTRTRRAIFRLKAGALAVPAQVVRVELDDPQKVDGFWVPTSGLTRASRGLWSVLVVEGDESDSRASRRDVEVLHTDGSRVMVRGTLESGDRVIVDGTHRIVAGQRVRLGHPRVAEIR